MFSNPKQCSMKVDWLMPFDTPNNLIESYRIDFALAGTGAKNTWAWKTVESTTCGGTGRTTCELDMKKVIAGDYGLKTTAGIPFFAEGDEIYARTTAIGVCFESNGIDKKESAEAAYDNTPVKL